MLDNWVLEAIGYLASALVAISLMMSSILRLRLINLAGAAVFTVYGLLIHAYPVAAVNLFIVFINLYYLSRMRRTEEFFRLLEMRPDSEYVRAFLDFHEPQIRRFLPGFASDPAASSLAVFVLRDLVPAGLLLGRVEGQTLYVDLDFVIPQYRDFKVGRFLFTERADFFRQRGIAEVVSASGSREHAQYLEKMGFHPTAPDGAPGQRYRLAIG
jgi:GNAT superfamily N-acetyltransferase